MAVGVGVGVGVAVCRGFGVYVDVAGVLVLPRLGAVVDRVGVAVVRRGGVDEGLDGVADGTADEASSAGRGVVTDVSWLVARGVPVCRMTNHPTPASSTSADNDASRGPATPLLRDRLWFVMLSSLAQANACQLQRSQHFTKL
ncbi:MAG TPA: hypothetical protein VG497_28065 [Kribbella sp.]|nr:hypothetical protein [Kribbella sp.]